MVYVIHAACGACNAYACVSKVLHTSLAVAAKRNSSQPFTNGGAAAAAVTRRRSGSEPNIWVQATRHDGTYSAALSAFSWGLGHFHNFKI
jgi:hypothetical protein